MDATTKRRLQGDMKSLMKVLRIAYNNKHGEPRTRPSRKWGELACENGMLNGWGITPYGIEVLDYLEYHASLGNMPTGIPSIGL